MWRCADFFDVLIFRCAGVLIFSMCWCADFFYVLITKVGTNTFMIYLSVNLLANALAHLFFYSSAQLIGY